MSSEILSVLEYMEKEKGISRSDMIETITQAVKNAALKGSDSDQELKIEINPKSGALKAWRVVTVSDPVTDPQTEISLDKARENDPEAKMGDVLQIEIDPEVLGRIAAQTARQAIMQRVRQFEKERIYDDYKDLVGDIVSGVVRRKDRSDLIVDLGKAEATLPYREQVFSEGYSPGERIRCLLLAIDNTPRGPELVLSRSHLKLIRRLFELEVTEISDGTVTIEGMAREPGYRTKICVCCKDPKVDPVGACVGARGARVKSIVRELGGEKVDIIRYHEDPQKLLEEAIKPAVPQNIQIDEKKRRIYFEVTDKDLSVAIGKKGLNAKLTSRLIGWKLDISKVSSGEKTKDDYVKEAVNNLARTFGISSELSLRLVNSGFTQPAVLQAGVGVEDLVGMGFTEEEAGMIIGKVNEHFGT